MATVVTTRKLRVFKLINEDNKTYRNKIITLIYLIFKLENQNKIRISKINKVNLIIKIIKNEDIYNKEDKIIYDYLQDLRNKEEEELRRIIEYKFEENIYKFHKIDNNIRKYINNMIIKYEEKQIYYKYIWINKY